MEVVEADQEAGVVALVFDRGGGDECFGRLPQLPRLDHDRRAVGVLGADIAAVVAAHALEAHPDVGLYGLDDVADVQVAVGVGQSAGNQYLAGHSRRLSHGWARCRSVSRRSSLPRSAPC
jgi:hypothetical protein